MAIEPYQQTETHHIPFEAPMHRDGSTMMQMTNPNNLLEDMELTFRSMIRNEEGIPMEAGEPLMNDKGISSVRGQIQSLVNQVTVMSNLDKHDIDKLRDYFADCLAKDLMMNRINYGMTFTTRDKIFTIAINTSLVCMKRALDEGEKRFWKGSQHEARTIVQGMGQQQGLGRRLFGGFLRR